MKVTKNLLIGFVVIMTISCGGGGGGGDSSGSGGSGGSGQVSQQSMDEFVSFITDNLSGCTSQTVSASLKNINISSVLASSIESYDRYQSLPAPVKSIIQAVGVPEEITGVCDTGSLSVTPTVDSASNISGTLNFTQCSIALDGDSALINGPLSFSLLGNDVNQLDLSSITASSSGITLNTSGESLTAQFNISSSFTTSNTGDLTGLNATITSISVTDNTLNQQYSLTNTTIQGSGLDTDVVVINSSGTYNDPELGIFTFSTPSPLTIDSTTPGAETVTGSVQADGANNSGILVTINANDDLIFQADADGDGNTDFSDTVNCSSLDTSSLPSL